MDFFIPEEKYHEMSDEDIILIAYQPEGTKLEMIPIIQKELLRRGKQEEAIMLSDYLIAANQKVNLARLSDEELRQHINERLEQGESLDVIRLDMKESGINIFDIIASENKDCDKAFDYISELKQQGLEEDEVDDKIKERFDLDQDEIEDLKMQRMRSGRQSLILGYSIVGIMGLLVLILLSMGGSISIGAILIIAIGVWRIYAGYEKMK